MGARGDGIFVVYRAPKKLLGVMVEEFLVIFDIDREEGFCVRDGGERSGKKTGRHPRGPAGLWYT